MDVALALLPLGDVAGEVAVERLAEPESEGSGAEIGGGVACCAATREQRVRRRRGMGSDASMLDVVCGGVVVVGERGVSLEDSAVGLVASGKEPSCYNTRRPYPTCVPQMSQSGIQRGRRSSSYGKSETLNMW